MSDAAIPITTTEVAPAWGVALTAAGCPQCGAAFLLPLESADMPCPACAAAALAPQPVRARPEPPELAAPYQIDTAGAANALADWTRRVWLRPAGFTPERLRAGLRPLFLPMWLADARAAGTWQARMGFDYQVASSQVAYAGGRWAERQVNETRIRWEPRAGQIERAYQNVPAPALEDHARLVAGLGAFDLGQAVAYTPNAMRAAAARVPELDPDAAWPLARPKLERLASRDCQAASAAQHVEDFQIDAEYTDLNWTQLLLPVYATSYQDEGGARIPVLVHGQTGRIYGVPRASQKLGWRWTGGLLAAALACILLALLFAQLAADWSPLFFIAALLLALGSPFPVAWAWQFNRSHPLEKEG